MALRIKCNYNKTCYLRFPYVVRTLHFVSKGQKIFRLRILFQHFQESILIYDTYTEFLRFL